VTLRAIIVYAAFRRRFARGAASGSAPVVITVVSGLGRHLAHRRETT